MYLNVVADIVKELVQYQMRNTLSNISVSQMLLTIENDVFVRNFQISCIELT